MDAAGINAGHNTELRCGEYFTMMILKSGWSETKQNHRNSRVSYQRQNYKNFVLVLLYVLKVKHCFIFTIRSSYSR